MCQASMRQTPSHVSPALMQPQTRIRSCWGHELIMVIMALRPTIVLDRTLANGCNFILWRHLATWSHCATKAWPCMRLSNRASRCVVNQLQHATSLSWKLVTQRSYYKYVRVPVMPLDICRVFTELNLLCWLVVDWGQVHMADLCVRVLYRIHGYFCQLDCA